VPALSTTCWRIVGRTSDTGLMRSNRFVAVAGFALIAGVVAASGGTTVEHFQALEPNQLGFYRNPIPGRFALWTVKLDGTDEHRLISRLNGAEGHRSSPSFRLVAYARRGGIYLMRPDGTRKRRIIGPGVPIDASAELAYPAWSRDGRSLAFVARCDSVTFGYGIYRADINGGSPRALITCGGQGGNEVNFPDWSPTGWVAYYRYKDSKHGIWAIRPDGTDDHLILRTAGRVTLSWSPDGQRLAYDDKDGLWVVDADGDNRRRLIGGCYGPDWDPTTDMILCGGTIDGQSGAFTIRPSGTGLRLIHRQRIASGEGRYFWMRSPSG